MAKNPQDKPTDTQDTPAEVGTARLEARILKLEDQVAELVLVRGAQDAKLATLEEDLRAVASQIVDGMQVLNEKNDQVLARVLDATAGLGALADKLEVIAASPRHVAPPKGSVEIRPPTTATAGHRVAIKPPRGAVQPSAGADRGVHRAVVRPPPGAASTAPAAPPKAPSPSGWSHPVATDGPGIPGLDKVKAGFDEASAAIASLPEPVRTLALRQLEALQKGVAGAEAAVAGFKG